MAVIAANLKPRERNYAFACGWQLDDKRDQVERPFSLFDPRSVPINTHTDGRITYVKKPRYAARVETVTVSNGELLIVANGRVRWRIPFMAEPCARIK